MLPAIKTNINWKAQVRATIHRHCSQTKTYKGASDLFYPVYGLGEGIWGLKEFREEDNEINPFENRQIKSIWADPSITHTEKESVIMARRGQGDFRKLILQKFKKCLVTKIENPKLLIASHIKPWRSSTNYERLSSENGIALSPLFDKLFDLGYISFNKKMQIIVSEKLSKEDIAIISFDTKKIYIPSCSKEMQINFEYHNDIIFRK